MQTRTFARLAVAASALAAVSAGAQTARTGGAPTRLGLLAGANFATVGGSDAGDASNRTGLVAGAYLLYFGGSPTVAIRPELLYSQKGSGLKGADEGTVKIDYIEVPVLVQYNVPMTGPTTVRPHLYIGPAFALKAKCSVEAKVAGSKFSTDCDAEGVDGADIKSLDVGAMAGGGLGFDVGGRTVTVGARYELGLTKLTSESNVKNRVISLYGSLELPLR